jgi:ADP-heptose:LPS heptosyltransferase
MGRILLQPYSAIPTDAKELGKNPKDWPFFNELIEAMPQHQFIQIGVGNKPYNGAAVINTDRKGVIQLINECDTWICVDTWLQHVATLTCKKRGIVIFSRSEPKMFGHPQNINLLKSQMYVQDPYKMWLAANYSAAAFVSVDKVVEAVNEILK